MGPHPAQPPAAALVADEPVAMLVNGPDSDRPVLGQAQLAEPPCQRGLELLCLLRVFAGMSPARALQDSPAFFNQ
jgi:hypothetical protein